MDINEVVLELGEINRKLGKDKDGEKDLLVKFENKFKFVEQILFMMKQKDRKRLSGVIVVFVKEEKIKKVKVEKKVEKKWFQKFIMKVVWIMVMILGVFYICWMLLLVYFLLKVQDQNYNFIVYYLFVGIQLNFFFNFFVYGFRQIDIKSIFYRMRIC